MWVSCGTRMHRKSRNFSTEGSHQVHTQNSQVHTQNSKPHTENNLSCIIVKAKVLLLLPFTIFHFSSDNADSSLLDSLGCCISE